MQTQVFSLNQCIESCNILNTLSDSELRFMYTRLWDEYNINKQLIYRLSVVKYDYFIYLDNLYTPYIKYVRDNLVNRKLDVDSIDEKLGVKISE